MRAVPLIVLSIVATPASAAVLSAGDHGFEIQHSVNLVVPQPEAYNAFGRVGQWWNSEHTYSGDARQNDAPASRREAAFASRSMMAAASSICGSTFVQPGERIVLTGSLGPLLYEATTGVMDVKFERIAGGSRVT